MTDQPTTELADSTTPPLVIDETPVNMTGLIGVSAKSPEALRAAIELLKERFEGLGCTVTLL